MINAHTYTLGFDSREGRQVGECSPEDAPAMKRVWSHWIQTKLAAKSKVVGGFDFDSCVERLRKCQDLSEGRAIHAEIVAAGHRGNQFLGNCLVRMYGRLGSLREAEIVFEEMDEETRDGVALLEAYACNGTVDSARVVFDSLRQKPSSAWSLMIKTYARLGHLDEAKNLYMQNTYPDKFAATILLTSFVDKCYFCEANKIFSFMPERDVIAWNAAVSAFSLKGELDKAATLFSKMPMHGASATNSMLQGYSQAAMITEAKFIFDDMKERSVISMTAMLAAYAQGRDYFEARTTFDKMPHHDLISCNAILTACSSCGRDLSELQTLFGRMHTRDIVSWTVLLGSYARDGHIGLARALLAKLPRYDSLSATAVIEAYGKAGRLPEARALLEDLPERHLEPCTVLMEAYSRNGFPLEAVYLFQDLELDGSTEPDGAIFTTLLSACSHGGLVRLGLDYFAAMAVDHRLPPSALHYSCVADMLGRAGLLQEVGELAEKMPFLPVESMWIALLNACKIHDDRRWGAVAAERASTLRPDECVPYVMIAGFQSSPAS